MKKLGLLLIIAGIVVLASKGLMYTQTTMHVDAGPLQASVQRSRPVPPLVGACAIAGGLLLLLLARKPV